MTITLNEQNKSVTLQMAAEAFLLDENGKVKTKDDLIRALVVGNKHASAFEKVDAEHFAAHWEAVSQTETATGFSGTLFKSIANDPETGAKKTKASCRSEVRNSSTMMSATALQRTSWK